jgi:hypothetical protein
MIKNKKYIKLNLKNLKNSFRFLFLCKFWTILPPLQKHTSIIIYDLGFLGSLFSSSVFLLLRSLLERDGFYYGHQGLFYSVFLLLGCWFFLGLLTKYETSLEIGVLCFMFWTIWIYIQWIIASIVPSKGKDWSFFSFAYRLMLQGKFWENQSAGIRLMS